MKVTLLSCTGMNDPNPDAAINVLLYTKSTRLKMHPGLLAEIASWSPEKKAEEMEYMANTLPSSWEFVDYTFLIEGVTRAFTHQLVRTRQASYAQQAMRVVNVEGWEYATGPTIAGDPERNRIYREAMAAIAKAYDELIAAGASREDARGLLPTNILTNINMKINMRNFVDLVKKRSTLRVQDEYRAVLDQMVACVLAEHPWMSVFLSRSPLAAAKELDQEIDSISDPEKRMRMLKLANLMMQP